MRITGISIAKKAVGMKQVCEHKEFVKTPHPNSAEYTQFVCANKECGKVLKTVAIPYAELADPTPPQKAKADKTKA